MPGFDRQETARAVFPGNNARVGQGVMSIGGHVDVGAIHINNVKHNAERTPAEVKRNLIEVFKYESMTNRRDNIDRNYRRTCSWLTQTMEWLRWRHEPSGLLWIKGHPGTGKSTIMKYALRHIQKRDREHVVAYFFDARSATKLDKSAEGLYRSLLVQFLQQIPEEAIYESASLKEASEEGADKTWSPPRLLEMLQEAIHLLEPDPITVFIDALDECSEEMLQDTVDHLGDLLESCDSQLRICFASRHFPHITRRGAIDLRLENQDGHYQDVILYIEGHLDSSKMHLSDRVRKSLQKKARGSFIWAYLVIRLLKEEYRRGRVAGLEARVETLPKRLEHLYKEILDTKEGDFRKETLICFSLVLLAQQSLKVGDLWWAIRLTCLPAGKDIGVLFEESMQMSDDDWRRSILDVSCGLVMDSVDSDALYDVRFIHETTREFCQEQTGLLSVEKKAEIHEAYKSLCWRTAQYYDGKGSIPHWGYQFSTILFLDYALDNVLGHANLAQEHGIDQSAFLREFVARKGPELLRQAPMRIHPASEMVSPGLIDRLVGDNYSFLLSDCQLLHELASSHNRIGLISDTGEYPLIWRAIAEHFSTPVSLLHLHTERRKHEPQIYTLLTALQSRGIESLMEFYPEKVMRYGFRTSAYSDVLFALAETFSHVASFFIVSVTPSTLLDANDLVKIRDAALSGFVNIFHLLLQQRLPAGPSTFLADDAMRWACKNGHTSVVKVLLEGYVSDLGLKPSALFVLPPLVQAALEGHVDVMELLLKFYKARPESLLDQVITIEGEDTMYPRSKEVVELLVQWRLDHDIPATTSLLSCNRLSGKYR
ncbi:hypothetical protein CC79DRAFT_146123 [Sarocladium strictum]